MPHFNDTKFTQVEPVEKHTLRTRVLHGGLALAILTQLLTSLAMEGPDDVQSGDLLFQIHRYSGLTAALLALALWLVILTRRRGTDLGALLPWFSGTRLSALWFDLRVHMAALIRLRLPAHDPDAALPAAVHGLGLLLISAMALSGTIYFLQVMLGVHSAEPDGMLAMTVHVMLANLVWAYLIGHAGLGMLHHLLRSASLTQMWSLRR